MDKALPSTVVLRHQFTAPDPTVGTSRLSNYADQAHKDVKMLLGVIEAIHVLVNRQVDHALPQRIDDICDHILYQQVEPSVIDQINALCVTDERVPDFHIGFEANGTIEFISKTWAYDEPEIVLAHIKKKKGIA